MGKKIKGGYAVLALVVALLMGGCAVFPKVTYLTLPNEDAEGAIKFYLQGSQVTLGIPKENSAGGVTIETTSTVFKTVQALKNKGICAVVTPAESKNHFYALKPHESIWSKTSISVSYLDNTRLIRSIGTTFKDNRIAVINTVGAMVASIVSGDITIKGVEARLPVEPEVEPLSLPVVIDLSDMKEAPSSLWKTIPGHSKWWYSIKLSPPPHDSEKTSEYFGKTRVSRALAYSICQDATLFVINSPAQPVGEISGAASFNIRIANPNYVCTLNLPAKGSITMHSVCGADIKTEEYDAVSSLDVLDALMKQVEAIKQAQNK